MNLGNKKFNLLFLLAAFIVGGCGNFSGNYDEIESSTSSESTTTTTDSNGDNKTGVYFFENDTDVYYNYALKYSNQNFPFTHQSLVDNNNTKSGASSGKVTIFYNTWIELYLGSSSFSSTLLNFFSSSTGTIGLKKSTGDANINIYFNGGSKNLSIHFSDYHGDNVSEMNQLNTKVTINPPTLGTGELAMDNFIDGISNQTLLYPNQTMHGVTIGGGENKFKVSRGANPATYNLTLTAIDGDGGKRAFSLETTVSSTTTESGSLTWSN